MKPEPESGQPGPLNAASTPAAQEQVQPAMAPTESPPASAPPEPGRFAWPLLLACLVVFPILTCPTVETELCADLSLNAALHFAAEHRLQFGVDVVSTYGPLGYLIFPQYWDHAPVSRVVADVVVSFVVAAGLCLLAWRLRWVPRCLLLLAFVWAVPNMPLRTDLLLHTGIFCWGLLSFVEAGRGLRRPVFVFCGFAAFCVLAKLSFFLPGMSGLILLSLHLVLNGRRRLALAAVGVFCGVFLTGWVSAGQRIPNIWPFLSRTLPVLQSYNAALGVEGLQSVRSAGIAVVLLAFLSVGLRILAGRPALGRDFFRRGALFAWAGLSTFIVWKHGFVRGDVAHVGFFLGWVPVLVLGLEAGPPANRAAGTWSRVLGAAAALTSLAALQIFTFRPLPESFAQPLLVARENFRRVFFPGAFEQNARAFMEAQRDKFQFPRCRQLAGKSTVDVFGQNQVLAIWNDLNYHPRPVFQSYSACDARLMRLNEQFLLSRSAPDYVLFELAPLDRKFAPLEDAWLLRDLLINFEPVAFERNFVLLKRTASDPPRLSLLNEGSVRPGEPIDLSQWNGQRLWLEIDLAPSFLGRMRELLYRPPTIRLAAWRTPGNGLLYRHQAAAPMLRAGFLASPLLSGNASVMGLYGPTNAPAYPGAYSLDLREGTRCWKPRIGFRVYRIENPFKTAPAEPAKAGEAARSMADLNGTNAAQGLMGRVSPRPPFQVFKPQRWRPGFEAPGSLNDVLGYAVFVMLPIASGVALAAFYRRARTAASCRRWTRLLLGNALIFVLLLSLALLAGETWFRFFYDTTDSLAYTKVCEKWVLRHWKVNAAGCRDNIEYSPRRTAGRTRFSFIGDSFTAGHGIRNVDDRLANRLRRAHPEAEIHVLANIGLDTGAELGVLKHVLAQGYELDQVVLVYCLNDIGDLAPEQIAAYERVLASVNGEGWLVRNSYMLNLLYERFQVWRHPFARNYASYVQGMYNGPEWQRQKERLKAFRDLVLSRGGRLRVITFPLLHALGPDYPYAGVHRELDQLWRELEVPHLDLLPVFKGIPAEELVVNAYDAHPNERASRLAAEAAEPFLFGSKR